MGSAIFVTLFAPISIVLLAETVKLSSIVTVPPAESIVKFPELVSISLSAVIPTCTFPAVFPVEVTLPENVPVVALTAAAHDITPLPFVINILFESPSFTGNVKVCEVKSAFAGALIVTDFAFVSLKIFIVPTVLEPSPLKFTTPVPCGVMSKSPFVSVVVIALPLRSILSTLRLSSLLFESAINVELAVSVP